MSQDGDGRVVEAGPRTRTIPASIRRALAARDRTCRFPGCTSRRGDAHHIEHWADGGATRLDNLMLLCRRHHRALHEGGFDVEAAASGAFVFYRPDGGRLDASPPAAPPRVPTFDPQPAPPPTWDGTPLDVVYAIDVMWRPRHSA